MRVDQLERGSPVDVWLLKEGKFRIAIPKDGDSLFKAIAEQALLPQNKIEIVAQVFQRNVTLYAEPWKEPQTVGKFGGTKAEIVLRIDDGHFECILPIAYMEAAAVAQSIIYELLYEKLFDVSLTEQSDTVKKVRQKLYNNINKSGNNQEQTSYTTSSPSSDDSANTPTHKEEEKSEYPPFPFRVAKSLDPAFFRNAQYDIWLDSKKAADQIINSGDKVAVRKTINGEEICLTGYVQSVNLDNTASVYVDNKPGCGTMTCDLSSITKVSISAKPMKPMHGKEVTSSQINDYNFQGRYGDYLSDTSDITPVCNQAYLQAKPPYFVGNLVPTSTPRLQAGMMLCRPSQPRMATYSGPVPNAPVMYGKLQDYNHTQLMLPRPCGNVPSLQSGYNNSHLHSHTPQPSSLIGTNMPVPYWNTVQTDRYQQACTVPSGLAAAGSPATGLPSGSLVIVDPYFFPPLPFVVPYITNISTVDGAAPASCDVEGKDLPSHIPTLRFFFNIGHSCLQYYRDVQGGCFAPRPLPPSSTN